MTVLSIYQTLRTRWRGVRRFVRKFAIWAVAASVVYLAWWILDGANLHAIWSQPGHHGSFWLAVDTVVAVTVSWAPLVADYTQTHGTAWRTFRQVGAEELDFAWEADAAWGGCWVARVGGFRKALRGPAGVDRNASRSALVAEVNSSPSARAELARALSRGEGCVA